ncbi:MAG TPA: pyridoxamine 5'-phosphate oxidase family protein [Terriglobales bacterium]|nr:pyridoxamine 5'-phosphate oxidase family protein [Terriglobales bacterium]
MLAKFHEGELEVQRRAGVPSDVPLGKSLRTSIPAQVEPFLAELPFVVVASVSLNGDVWASLLSGQPGFLRALDEHTIAIAAGIATHDPLFANLSSGPGAPVGLLAIDLATRRRVRLNGSAQLLGDDEVRVEVGEVFFNCPQYIQLRGLERVGQGAPLALVETRRGTMLTQEQVCAIAHADTFFIASAHSSRGADASHRGGSPGFVRVESPRRLLFPDYSGNNMFQTLGNLVMNPRSGLLFVDFMRGSTLQLAGAARVLWDDPRLPQFPGALRLVEFEIAEVVQAREAIEWRGDVLQYSPVNPPAPSALPEP